ncbi:alpha/beta fold hydrolase [Prescottella agglutinans]|uniref:Pimeloyl-ACP methyl ester carboxylesterase n=1 Tax=Prescottella agglutinans TaxID=1644129 RepID=A0ABT6M4F8_9NOCA|nr:alpha/beta hydrolase [Prescottella agglutinans]MDH6279202.1 pimeloyl-ACP methyl ester carboxylesterase [Prescottella agglutinans]
MNLLNRLGLFGGIVGVAAIGTIAGLEVVKAATTRRGPEVYGSEDFELMSRDRSRVVPTEDDVPLLVREVGPADAPLTVIFVHGYCLRMESWHFQRKQLAQMWGDSARMVFYDQRGHGESAMPAHESCTIAQLGRDLATVIDAVAPSGPVVVVGHSMGGMTILAMARQFPELFDDRVIGVGLLATTAAGLNKSGLGRNLDNPVIDGFRLAVRTAPGMVQQARGAARAIISPILRAASYGTEVSPRLVAFSEGMLNDTSVVTIVNFLESLELHDESEALPVLADTPSLVLCGDTDMIIPFPSSRSLAAALPRAELVRVRGAGHLSPLEFPQVTSDAIDRLVRRAVSSRENRENAASAGELEQTDVG